MRSACRTSVPDDVRASRCPGRSTSCAPRALCRGVRAFRIGAEVLNWLFSVSRKLMRCAPVRCGAVGLGFPARSAVLLYRIGLDRGHELLLPGSRKSGCDMPLGDRPPEPLSSAEVRALLAACSPESLTGMRARALLVVLWRAGLRCAEALALRPCDVDFAAGTIRVRFGKGRKARTVGIDG